MEEEIIKSTNDEKGESRIKIIAEYIKYLPVIYPILVFLGYINYDLFYKRFDINIFNYLNMNELLFSFVSLAYPLMFMIIASTAYNVFSSLMNLIFDNNEEEEGKEVGVEKNKTPLFFKKNIL